MSKVAVTLSRYSKFIAAIVGAITEAVNLGYVPHVAQSYVSMAVTILTALGVVGVSNGPALADGTAIANDLASLKEQIGPLPKTGGIKSVVEWLATEARGHGAELAAIVEAAKADIEDLIHQPAVSMDPPTTEAAPVTLTEPTSDEEAALRELVGQNLTA